MNKPDQLFCLIRQQWVAALPEELVRQHFIQYMRQSGYPLGNLVLEKDLRQLPHLTHSPLELPKRRTDLVVLAKSVDSTDLRPLLLVECKAVKFTAKIIRQLIGYNFYLQAPFVALVNASEVKLGWYEHSIQDFEFISYLPTYSDLLAKWKENEKR